ncbi:LysR family transcriptional regulator [Rubritalea profundi]|uniref:HTH-type transcriptional regulator MetR n=1 Tax=Rubritalea profundi TaxID=1658618 RepID=A0A2S7TXV0_9BACT|nr:LysR family transcriptional regulator [Rubritalea profundi]PQJ27051.1 LysR family transcriptional regulator [Rubritalea profundi]
MTYLERIHLEIILAVEKEGSMTAAAESLHLTQSALSHSIRKLEDQLGVKLWQRKGRQLLPTQAGQHLLKTAKRQIPQFIRTENQLIQFSRGERGLLRIGMECHPCYQWLQTITNSYLQDWPSVDLDVIQRFKFAAMEALLAHEIDIIVTPDPVRKKQLTFVPVFDYEPVLVVGADHPYKDYDYVEPKDLSEETLFTYPVCSDRLDIFSNFLTPVGRTVKIQKLIETTEIMIQMVACGRGVTALPRWLVDEFAESYDIFPVKLGKEGVQKQIYLGIREEDADVDYIQAFLNQAQSPSVVT